MSVVKVYHRHGVMVLLTGGTLAPRCCCQSKHYRLHVVTDIPHGFVPSHTNQYSTTGVTKLCLYITLGMQLSNFANC